MCFLAYREDLGSGGVEFQSMRSCRCIRLNWSVAYSEGREATRFPATLTQTLAEADKKGGSTDEPRR
jgi:hypothetical protein